MATLRAHKSAESRLIIALRQINRGLEDSPHVSLVMEAVHSRYCCRFGRKCFVTVCGARTKNAAGAWIELAAKVCGMGTGAGALHEDDDSAQIIASSCVA